MTIGAQLRRERVRAGLTQADLAARLGVHTVYVCQVETDVRRPSRVLVDRWAEATGAGSADLVLEGPELFDVAFEMGMDGLDPFAARRVLVALSPSVRRLVCVWPASGGALRLRARASALPAVVGLTGKLVEGIGHLPAPTVQPVSESTELTAWLRASSNAAAVEHVERRLARAGASGSVSVTGDGRLFVAVVGDLAADASIRLQELVDCSPLGLFVPRLRTPSCERIGPRISLSV